MNFYLTWTKKIIGFIFSGIGFTGLLIVSILFLNSDLELANLSFGDDALEKGTALNYYLPYLIPGLAFSVFLLVGLLIMLTYYRKKSQIMRLLMRTEPIQATVIRNIQNFHVQMNRMPRREVTFKTQDGNLYEYHFFSEQLASLFKENMVLDIVIDRKKAYPAISFFEQVTNPDTYSESAMSGDATGANSKQTAFESFVESAQNFEKSGDKEGAISFYEGALGFQKDTIIAQKLIVLYRQTDKLDKITALEQEMKRW